MVDLILEISRPGVFDIRCLNWNTATILLMGKYCTWIEDDIESSLNSHVYRDTLYHAAYVPDLGPTGTAVVNSSVRFTTVPFKSTYLINLLELTSLFC